MDTFVGRVVYSTSTQFVYISIAASPCPTYAPSVRFCFHPMSIRSPLTHMCFVLFNFLLHLVRLAWSAFVAVHCLQFTLTLTYVYNHLHEVHYCFTSLSTLTHGFLRGAITLVLGICIISMIHNLGTITYRDRSWPKSSLCVIALACPHGT